MSKSEKRDSKGNKADYQRAMGRLEEAVKELGDAAKGNFSNLAADVLEQAAARLKSDSGSDQSARSPAARSGSQADDTPSRTAASDSAGSGFGFGSKRVRSGRLGHWRGDGAPRPFRDLDNGKLWGICAGIAPYLGLEVWVVRCLAVTAFIFAPQIIVPAYIIGYFVLDEHSDLDELIGAAAPPTTRRMRKRHARLQRAAVAAETRAQSKASRARAGGDARNPAPLPARNVLRSVQATLNEAELRLRRMEGHVTSGRYELQKELRKIERSPG